MKKKTIPKTLKQIVWDTYNGKNNRHAKCFCCNHAEIDTFNFQCGHVISEYNGGETTVENLRPICALCNSSMGTKNMIEFMETYKLTSNKINQPNKIKEIKASKPPSSDIYENVTVVID